MTTVKCTFNQTTIALSPQKDGTVSAHILEDPIFTNRGDVTAQFPTAELLAALKARPIGEACEPLGGCVGAAFNDWKARAEAAEAKLAERSAELEQWQHTAAELEHERDAATADHDELREELLSTEMGRAGLEAERDAHAATIGRVRKVAQEFYKVRGDWYTEDGGSALKTALLAALDPKPALPAEPGSVIFIDADVIQERDGIPAACQTDGRFRALDGSAGGWDRDTITAWRPAKVVAE